MQFSNPYINLLTGPLKNNCFSKKAKVTMVEWSVEKGQSKNKNAYEWTIFISLRIERMNESVKEAANK